MKLDETDVLREVMLGNEWKIVLCIVHEWLLSICDDFYITEKSFVGILKILRFVNISTDVNMMGLKNKPHTVTMAKPNVELA